MTTQIFDPGIRADIEADITLNRQLLEEMEHAPLDRITNYRWHLMQMDLLEEEIRDLERLLEA